MKSVSPFELEELAMQNPILTAALLPEALTDP